MEKWEVDYTKHQFSLADNNMYDEILSYPIKFPTR